MSNYVQYNSLSSDKLKKQDYAVSLNETRNVSSLLENTMGKKTESDNSLTTEESTSSTSSFDFLNIFNFCVKPQPNDPVYELSKAFLSRSYSPPINITDYENSKELVKNAIESINFSNFEQKDREIMTKLTAEIMVETDRTIFTVKDKSQFLKILNNSIENEIWVLDKDLDKLNSKLNNKRKDYKLMESPSYEDIYSSLHNKIEHYKTINKDFLDIINKRSLVKHANQKKLSLLPDDILEKWEKIEFKMCVLQNFLKKVEDVKGDLKHFFMNNNIELKKSDSTSVIDFFIYTKEYEYIPYQFTFTQEEQDKLTVKMTLSSSESIIHTLERPTDIDCIINDSRFYFSKDEPVGHLLHRLTQKLT